MTTENHPESAFEMRTSTCHNRKSLELAYMQPRILIGAALAVMSFMSGTAGAADDPSLDPNTMATLQKMGAYLRSLTAFQVDAVTSDEDVLDDGQKITYTGTTKVLARMPDR